MKPSRTRVLFALLLAAPAAAQTGVPADTASPEAAAAAVLRQCRGLLGPRARCVEQALDGVLERSGVARAMAVLDAAVARSPRLTPQAHGIAHGLGIAAYRSPETVAATFASCPNTQISGCYHGVIQGYFLDVSRRTGEVSAAELNALCEPHRDSAPLYFECTHGMGHGLMAAYAHRLPDALARCDLVDDPMARDSCWSGAFMENIVAAMHPGHTAEAHAAVSHHASTDQGGMDHGGMDHGAMGHAPPARPWRPLDYGDVLYPCTAVDAKYHRACYTIQTGAILVMNGGRIGHAARACNRAPREMVSVCHAGLGRDVSAYARRDPRRAARLCARAGTGETDCLRGAAYALYDAASRPADALALCRAVGRDALKTACYQAVAQRVRISHPDPSVLAAVCADAEPAYVAPCRAAAGLPPAEGGG